MSCSETSVSEQLPIKKSNFSWLSLLKQEKLQDLFDEPLVRNQPGYRTSPIKLAKVVK
jgi:hypothetical protein